MFRKLGRSTIIAIAAAAVVGGAVMAYGLFVANAHTRVVLAPGVVVEWLQPGECDKSGPGILTCTQGPTLPTAELVGAEDNSTWMAYRQMISHTAGNICASVTDTLPAGLNVILPDGTHPVLVGVPVPPEDMRTLNLTYSLDSGLTPGAELSGDVVITFSICP